MKFLLLLWIASFTEAMTEPAPAPPPFTTSELSFRLSFVLFLRFENESFELRIICLVCRLFFNLKDCWTTLEEVLFKIGYSEASSSAIFMKSLLGAFW